MPDRDSFTLDFRPAIRGHRQFKANILSAGFAGRTGHSLDDAEIAAFLEALDSLPEAGAVVLKVGGEIADGPLLVVSIVPADRLGSLRVRVSMAADDDRARRVATHFWCVRADLTRFADEVRQAAVQGGTAILAPADLGWT